jgi:hypothetical protein
VSQSAVPVALSPDETFIDTMFTTVSRVSWLRSALTTVTVVESQASFVAGSMTSYVGQSDNSQSVTVVDIWTYSWTWYAVASATYIHIPVYETVTTRGFIVVVVSAPTPGASRMSDSLLIGIVTGAAVVVVLIIAATLYLVRSHGRASVTRSDQSEVGDLEPVQDPERGTTLGDAGEDTSSTAQPLSQSWAAQYGSLMSVSDEERTTGEERDMFV